MTISATLPPVRIDAGKGLLLTTTSLPEINKGELVIGFFTSRRPHRVS